MTSPSGKVKSVDRRTRVLSWCGCRFIWFLSAVLRAMAFHLRPVLGISARFQLLPSTGGRREPSSYGRMISSQRHQDCRAVSGRHPNATRAGTQRRVGLNSFQILGPCASAREIFPGLPMTLQTKPIGPGAPSNGRGAASPPRRRRPTQTCKTNPMCDRISLERRVFMKMKSRVQWRHGYQGQ